MPAAARMAAVDMPIIPVIAGLVRANPGTISLGQGVVNYGPPVDVAAALQPLQERPALHKYQAVSGMPELVEALRQKLRVENGIDDQAGTELMVSAGSNMAFLQAVLAVSDPGDEVILPSPYYFNQEMALTMVGCRAVMVPTDQDFQLDLAALEAAITPHTRAIVTVSPNNPTSAVYPQGELAAVNALCKAHGLYHFSDEAYEYFCYDGARHFSAASLPGAAGHTLSFYSFSKGFGMASWRVGYLLYPAHLFEAMNKAQDTNLICAPVVSQLVALAATRAGRPAVAAHLASLDRVRLLVHQRLQTLGSLVSFVPTQGAFYVLLRLPAVADPLAFNRTMIERFKVATIPGFAFGLEPAAGNYQRLSFGALEPSAVAEGVDRFIAAVKALC
ncbi:MAG: aminotransferase class I/II-fold pyridoxal phosphate-dependent enzyme [Lautropia sp.]|nr:aminotransferase class I/II-fold pyridoxal phosphate-dependent enzyme [Lautropia sp.]